MIYKLTDQDQDSFEDLLDKQAEAKGYITTEEIFLMFSIPWNNENINTLERYFGKEIHFEEFQETIILDQLI